MSESTATVPASVSPGSPGPRVPRAGAPEIRALGAVLAGLDQRVDDATRIDRIRALEELQAQAAAAQVRETAAFAASQRAAQRAAGVPEKRLGRGIPAQVGLARRISPFHAQRYTGWASILTSELPATYAALAAGRITEWRALLVARETGWLSRADRAAVDAELAPRLEACGDRRVEAEAKQAAYRRDPTGYLARIRGATKDRRVTVRPAPDVPVELNLIMTDHTLLHPETCARDLITGASPDTPRWLRRLYTTPDTRQLAAMDSRQPAHAVNRAQSDARAGRSTDPPDHADPGARARDTNLVAALPVTSRTTTRRTHSRPETSR